MTNSIRTIRPVSSHRSWLLSEGIWPRQSVQAGCDCGWVGPRRPLEPSGDADINSDLEQHLVEIGCARVIIDDDRAHRGCGYRHDFHDECPLPPTSPAGRLRRALHSGLGDPDRALDRIRAITELRSFLDDQQAEAVIAVALNQSSWSDLADAANMSIDEAKARWAHQLDRYANAGILPQLPDR